MTDRSQQGVLSSDSCNCQTVSDEYSDHRFECPVYMAGRAARIARTAGTKRMETSNPVTDLFLAELIARYDAAPGAHWCGRAVVDCLRELQQRRSSETCEHYWGRHDIPCQLPRDHRGQDHYYLVPGYAIRTDVKFEPPSSSVKASERPSIEPGPDLACDGFELDPHSQFCNKCGYPRREHRKNGGASDV